MIKKEEEKKGFLMADNNRWCAFTLAEVLITLGIIGVVAALTIPQLMANWQHKAYISSATNFERQMGEALRMMNNQGTLTGYTTTSQFVDALKRYMKITNICDSNNLTKCFAPKITIDDDKNTMNASDITAEKLGHSSYGTEAIGVQFANGVNAILAYNPDVQMKEDINAVKFSTSEEGKFKIINLSTDAFTMVYDVTGFTDPNKIGADIRGINSTFNANCTQIPNEPYCVLDLGHNYSAVNCSRVGYNDEYCGKRSNYTGDNWAGAVKACKDKGMRLPTESELEDIKNIGTFGVDGIPTSGTYWTIDEWDKAQGKAISLGLAESGYYYHGAMKDSEYAVLCIN